MAGEMILSSFSYLWDLSSSGWGGSVAREIAARVSMIMLIQRSWVTLKVGFPRVAPPRKVMVMHTMLTESWNWMNFLMLSRMFLPHWTALKTELKLSSRIMMSEASLATSQPEIPIQKPTLADERA